MPRRSFTLQMYPGRVGPPPIAPPPPDSVALAAVAPTWRCSGCLMAWGVYGPTTSDARPAGSGCEHCRDASWVADSPAARMIDEAAGIDSRQCLDQLHPAAPFAMAALEHAIRQGQWNRLTSTCERPLMARVYSSVEVAMDRWIKQFRSGKELRDLRINFDYSIGAVMKVEVCIAYPYAEHNDSRNECFTLRHRWVQ